MGDLEGKEEHKEGQRSLYLESKDNARDSYNKDECIKAVVHQKELLSSVHTNKSYKNEDSSDGNSIPLTNAISKKWNA